jgi:hypothetical protein
MIWMVDAVERLCVMLLTVIRWGTHMKIPRECGMVRKHVHHMKTRVCTQSLALAYAR